MPPGPACVTHLDGAGVGIERPVLAALLPGSDRARWVCPFPLLGLEQRRSLTEVEVGAGRVGTVVAVTEERGMQSIVQAS